jgi:hypothetical protein
VILGGLAMVAAKGGGPAPDSRNALATLLSQPFGAVLLCATALGFLAFAAWRFVQAGLDADRVGRSTKGILRRVGFAAGGVVALGLAFTAVRLAFMGAARGGDAAARDWTASFMALPAGRLLVGGAGLVLIGAGCGQAAKAWTASFERVLALSPGARRWAPPLGRLGYAARAVVFGLIGVFLCIAALDANAREAKGLSVALKTLEGQPYGWALLGATGLGLLAFGAFQFVMARYRVIATPQVDKLADAARRRL